MRAEFLRRVQALVGKHPAHGVHARGARLLGVHPSPYRQVAAGMRPVPAEWVARLEAVEAGAEGKGLAFARVKPRLEAVVSALVRDGLSEVEARAVILAWAASAHVGRPI